ncbi:hypothetical protein E6W39_18835 [Kitasatospora acidiphila]|uniref:Uncharacterized protein n=1 Tax=Kitasatospora acidiphila TaxID=2567942 RepID=A0A540W4G9_9ACTN|nr:hypothetical protein [Kitasatospora acidiphila]TQF03910.1 hypothetical protein E6W39_18835 [Kitasatospora acidiphila]
MTQFSIAAPELARLTHNALAFMPARSAVKVCEIVVGRMAGMPILQITATDLHTAGRDYSGLAELPYGALAAIDLSRDDLATLDKIARAKKKDDIRIQIRNRDGMSVEDDNGAWMPFRDASGERQPADLWDRVDEMLTRLERVSPVIPGALLIDPALMARFGKVKCPGETIADLYIASADEPILVKVGPTLVGAIMPVDREIAGQSERIGPEGLWEE